MGVTTKQYVKWGLQHILDTATYMLLSKQKATTDCNSLYQAIFQWTWKNRQDLGTDTIKYIWEKVKEAQTDPFGYFYLLAKLHERPLSTTPVCSDCASLPHAVGKWVDCQLQPIVQSQQTYNKNLIELKTLLNTMDTLPNNACFFTYDAISRYTNIDTTECINRLTTILTDPTSVNKYQHLKPKAVIEALHLVVHNNRMKFGNLIAHQHKGIAMGMASAPSIANLFIAIYKETHIPPFPTSSLYCL